MKDIFTLKGKVSVIIGGNGYLGKTYCRGLLDYGAIVYACDLNTTEDEETKALKKDYGDRYHLISLDATKKEELIALREKILQQEKRVDILVNSTTLKGNDNYLPFEDVSLEGWEIGLIGDLTIPFLTIQTFIPVMKKQQSGSIINTASIYGVVANDQRLYEGSNLHELYVKDSPEITRVYAHGVYAAGKGGLINFTKYLAAYYGENNVRVNCISPGGLHYDAENDTFVKKYSAKTPLGRKGKREEMVGALIYLASDASSYVTGHNLLVDGGFTIW